MAVDKAWAEESPAPVQFDVGPSARPRWFNRHDASALDADILVGDGFAAFRGDHRHIADHQALARSRRWRRQANGQGNADDKAR